MMNQSEWRTVFCKEMLEILRDRRSLVITLVFPMMIYPLLVLGFTRLTFTQLQDLSGQSFRVGLFGDLPPEGLIDWLETDARMTIVDARAHVARDMPYETGIHVKRTVRRDGMVNYALDVLYRSSDDLSRTAGQTLMRVLGRYAEEAVDARMRRANLDDGYLTPILLKEEDLSTPEEAGGAVMGKSLAGIVVIMALLGTFYPAVDLGAGERERGTLEPLLLACPKRMHLLVGKFLAIFLMGVFTCLSNLVGLALTFYAAVDLAVPGGVAFLFDVRDMTVAFMVLLPATAMFASAALAISIYARSVKEAQSLLTPFILVATCMSMMPLLPGVSLQGVLAFVPVANSSMLIKEALSGNLQWLHVLAVLLGNTIPTVVFLRLSLFLIYSEGVLYPVERTRWCGRVAEECIPLKPENTLSLTGVFMLICAVQAMRFYGSGVIHTQDMRIHHVIGQIVFLLLPAMLAAKFAGQPLAAVFPSRKVSAGWIVFAAAGALAVALGNIVLSYWMAHQHVWDIPADTPALQFLQKAAAASGSLEMIGALCLLAVLPAVCEEAFFRGVVLGNLQTHMSRTQAVWLSAAIFGLFHGGPFRAVPVFFAGLFFGYLMVRKRNLPLCILAHFTYNGVAVFLYNLSGAG